MTNFHVGQKTRSLRLGLVGWLQNLVDHLPQLRVQVLRRSKVQAEACSHCGNRRVVGVTYGGGEGQVENHMVMPALGEQVNILNWHPVVSHLPPISPDSQLATGLHNNFVNHDQGSYPNVANLNQHATKMFARGVRNNEQFMQLQAERLRGLFPKKSSGGGK